jgi:tetratricopeptide (TPR) repeat protein
MAEDFLASALYAAGRFDEAAVHAERACALNPRNDAAFTSLASIRERQGRPTEALALYRQALALRPDNAPVQMQLGLLELGLGQRDEARRRMAIALRAAPNLGEHTLQIAQTALQHRDAATALFLCNLVIAVTPDDAAAHVVLGAVLIQTGDRPGGLAEWRRALELNPDYPGLREQVRKLPGER